MTKLLQINLKFDGTKIEYLEAFGEAAKPIAAVPGLRWKIWPWNDAERVGGGILLFDDASSAQAYLEGPIGEAVAKHPAVSEISVKQFDILEGPTAQTRGPVSAQPGSKTFDQMAAEAFASVPTVQPGELQQWMQQVPQPIVIDVRDAAEIALTGTVPGAVHISLGSLTYKADHEVPEEWRDPRLHDRARLIVVTCEMGPMGALGGKLLQDMGFTNVYILEGGVLAWIEAGFQAVQLG